MKNEEYLIERHIKTKNKIRKIVTYNDGSNALRTKHQKIANFLVKNTSMSIFAKAYIKNRSIINNAKAHMYNDYFIMFDVKDFFPSINHNILVECLNRELNRKLSISLVECADIVKICSCTNKGLPLGLITSPILSNIYMKQFDNILYGKLKKENYENIIYTRYADDITISMKNSIDMEINSEKIKIIVTEQLKRIGLKLNSKKIRNYSLKNSNHVKITGINITCDSNNYRNLTVGRKTKDELYNRAIRYIECEKKDRLEALQIKGLESFVLSVEGKKYEQSYSDNMLKVVQRYQCNSLNELIKNIKY